MNLFSYKLEHDYGLAPNPFGGIMSLAVCKSDIRKNKNLSVGDLIVGTGSKSLGNLNHLIYAMQIEQLISFDEYWDNPEYEFKKPVMTGSLVQMYGDNFYHTDPISKKPIQEASAHAHPDPVKRKKHIERDTSGKLVPLSRRFYYFGENAPEIPANLREVCCKGRDFQYAKIPEEIKTGFIQWLELNYKPGIYGDPCDWKRYNLTELDIYED